MGVWPSVVLSLFFHGRVALSVLFPSLCLLLQGAHEGFGNLLMSQFVPKAFELIACVKPGTI